MAEYEVKSKVKVGPFSPTKGGHVEFSFSKENEKEKKNHFYKKPNLLSLAPENSSSSLFFFHVAFSFFSSPPLLSLLKLQIPLHFHTKLQGKAIFGV